MIMGIILIQCSKETWVNKNTRQKTYSLESRKALVRILRRDWMSGLCRNAVWTEQEEHTQRAIWGWTPNTRKIGARTLPYRIWYNLLIKSGVHCSASQVNKWRCSRMQCIRCIVDNKRTWYFLHCKTDKVSRSIELWILIGKSPRTPTTRFKSGLYHSLFIRDALTARCNLFSE